MPFPHMPAGHAIAAGLAAGVALIAAPLAPAAVHADLSGADFRCPPISGPGYCGDEGVPLAAGFAGPTDVAARPDGSYLIADAANNAVRLVAGGRIRTVAGGGPSLRGSGVALRAHLRFPAAVAWVGGKRFAVADTGNDRVLVIAPDGRYTTAAGSGWPGGAGDGGPARLAQLSSPAAIAPSPAGLLIADTGNHRVRVVHPDGTIATVAGTGMRGSGGDGGPATFATLDAPSDVAAVPGGGFVVATADGRLREVDASGTIRSLRAEPLAGAPTIAPASDGAWIVTEPATRRVLRIAADGFEQVLAAGGTCASSALQRPARAAGLGYPAGVSPAADGDVLVADSAARRIVRVRGPIVRVVAGEGLGVSPTACDGTASTHALLRTTPPGPEAADSQYAGLPCAPRSQLRFRLRFRFYTQGGSHVKKPRRNRQFRVYFYVSRRTQVVLSALRGNDRRWRAPRSGTSVREGNAHFTSSSRGLAAGRYKLKLRAQSDMLEQRICRNRKFRIRR